MTTAIPEKKEPSTVGWWIGWITLTIASFFVSCYFWTGVIARHAGNMDRPGVPILWVTAVFGSWMVLLVPLIIVMYRKVDKAYEDARIRRETIQFQKAKDNFRVRSILVEASERRLKNELTAKLKRCPETIKHGHLVTATLNNGQKVPNVFILNKKEVLGIYGVKEVSFKIADIADVEPVAMHQIPNFKSEEWLRLDGVGGEVSNDH